MKQFFLFTSLFFLFLYTKAQQSDTLVAAPQAEVIITGQFQPTDVRSALHPAKVISKADIQRRGAVTLSDLMMQEANVQIQNDPILGTSMSLNGLSGRNIKFLLNGVPIVGRQNGNIDLSQINLANVQRIEIIEGPMALMYGSDAIAGVVNIITQSYNVKPVEVQAQGRYETKGENLANIGVGFSPNSHHNFRLVANYQDFKGWDADTSKRNWTWNPKQKGNIQASWNYQNEKNLRLQAFSEIMQENIQNKGEIRRPQYNPYAFDDKYVTRRMHHQFTADFPIAKKHQFSIAAGGEQYYREKNTYRTDIKTDTMAIQPSESDTSRFNMAMLRVLHVWDFHAKWKLKSGFNAQYDEGVGKRFEDSLGNKKKTMQDYAVFSSLQWQINSHFTVEAGVRTGYNTRVKQPIIPSFQAKYLFPKTHLTLRAAYSQGFRTPDFKELYFQFVDINHNIVGNPDLKPENAHSFQASLAHQASLKKGQLNSQVRLFFNDIQNKIELYEYQLINGIKVPVTDTSTLLYSYFNIEHYQTWGANASVAFKNDWFQTNLNVSPTAYYQPDYKALNVKRYNFATQLQAELSVSHPKYHTSFRTFHRWNDKQISFSQEQINGVNHIIQTIRYGYWATDLIAGQTFWKEKIQVNIGVKNLWNIQQIRMTTNAVSQQGHLTDATTHFSPGRSYWCQLSVTL